MTGLLERDGTVLELVTNEKYELTLLEAEALVKRAEDNYISGMSHSPCISGVVWVTHMTTQGGKFMIELE
jgi:hypothetical protein